ncbi:MAG: 2-C-methyl-D-erythritol 4-phosphate cytidylyltransferase [Lachnospiraceae bacterium]|nr:2-C-methyl-D-erythritol 4-phosphate cytidylyltransferase [Lachnospiraceae bacterium]
MKCAAVVLAAGRGRRMNLDTAKQFIQINGFPLLYYSLKAFQESFIDEIVLVTSKNETDYCREEIVDKYGFDKVSAITEGGKERYHSVACGLKALRPDTDYVFIHDSARPNISEEILKRTFDTVVRYGSAIASVPVKDTVKTADEEGFVTGTPPRSSVYIIQTPQAFEYQAIKKAYETLLQKEDELNAQGIRITDDAMVMERFGEKRVKLCEGSYTNIKVTTPEDIELIKLYL